MNDSEEQKNAIESLELRDALDFAAVRNVLWRIIGMASPFEKEGPQTVEVANYNAGRKDMVRDIVDLIDEASPDHWILMQNENKGEADA